VNKNWLKRVERFEAIARPHVPSAVLRHGYILAISAGGVAERQVVRTTKEPTVLASAEHEFEERLGPAPGPTSDPGFKV
jgi:hypothetical protein